MSGSLASLGISYEKGFIGYIIGIYCKEPRLLGIGANTRARGQTLHQRTG